MKWWIVGGAIVWACTATVAAQGRGGGQGQGRDPWVGNLPPGPGKDLVAQRCASCHTLERTVTLRQSRDKWEAVVFDMIGRGAPIFLDEAKEMITYLSNVFRPDSPPLIDVNRAAKSDLVTLPGITPEMADRLVASRDSSGAIASHDQVRETLGLDEKAFESVRYYLYVAAPKRDAGSVAP